MIGQSLTHYRILAPLGAGGMGLVYRARDERLGREVALKVLPSGALGDEAARARLRREALALSRLNHPAIATVFEFDSERGTDFLVMELLTGVTLAERLEAGPLAERDVVEIGQQIAEALESAHEQGVVHRDLKPSNIMVSTRGRVKVLDFGLARLLDGAGAATNTSDPGSSGGTGPMIGTLAYMAPEQLVGGAVDARADLYALGAVLYEMATGVRPHAQTETPALLYAVAHTPPASPRSVRPQLSAGFEKVVLHALERDPTRRVPSASAMIDELRRLTAGPLQSEASQRPGAHFGARARIESLAVLPLANLSGDPAQEFFSDGMTEALIATLAQIGALRVISRTSAMQYKGTSRALPEIARALNVDAIVEGAVLRAGNRVRISATLIEGSSDRHLWARSYERDVDDVLALQSEIARAIADEVKVQLTPREESQLAAARPVNPPAYESYLKGRHLWSTRVPDDLRRSIEYFEKSIAADPTYALAYAGLADSWNILGDLAELPAGEAFARARAAAERALELDDQVAEAHSSLAFVHFFADWDWAAAARSFGRAIALKPGYATARHWNSELFVAEGRFNEGIAEGFYATKLDPLSPVINTAPADALFMARRFEEALAELRKTVEMAPTFIPGLTDMGRVLTHLGRVDEAIATFEHASTLGTMNPYTNAGLGYAFACAGRRDDALRVARLLEERIAKTGRGSAHGIASIYIGLGDLDHALGWLERAFELRDRALVWLNVHPRLDPLRSSPRFEALVRKVIPTG